MFQDCETVIGSLNEILNQERNKDEKIVNFMQHPYIFSRISDHSCNHSSTYFDMVGDIVCAKCFKTHNYITNKWE